MFKLAISAGHYLYTPGKCCVKSLDPNETKEWVLNDRIADKLEKNLSAYQCEVLRLDDTNGKETVSNSKRAKLANEWGADLYLSIHHNAAYSGNKTFSGGGIVAFIHDTKAKPGAADWQKVLYDASVKATGLKGNRATPLAKAALYECGAPNCPSVLMECGFMDSTVDVPIILSEDFANKMAKAFADAIVKKAGLKKKAATVTTSTKPALTTTVTLPVLSNGMKHEAVKTLQRILNALGYTDATEKPLAVDGSFGPATTYAFKNFQDQNKLEVDGRCGPASWKKLLNAI